MSSDTPRLSRSRSRRASTIFNSLKGRDSGQRTPVENKSLDNEQDESYSLPPSDNDSGVEYFAKLLSEQGGLSRSIRLLVESSNAVHIAALSCYLQAIPFSGLPLDMAMRYLLLHLPLPKEQGAIYRLLELFAKRYHTANPSLWDSHDQILVVCYSILMLNTDAWNTNNKVKMTREQYLRNTSGQGVCEDILSVFPSSSH
jgi:Sec7-like guanine-nucleotide exchange factor